jgi:hypothetical protein
LVTKGSGLKTWWLATYLSRCNGNKTRFAELWPKAQAVQLVRDCKAEADLGHLQIRDAAPWLAALET